MIQRGYGTCRRYNAEGKKCQNSTNRHDGWCGKCGGFTTPNPQPLPQEERSRSRTGKGKRRSGSITLEPEDLPGIQVSRSSICSFVDKHQCSKKEAEAQLKSMLEDFTLDSGTRTFRTPRGGWVLTNSGYTVVLSADKTTLTSYSTSHVERTWAQVKAGVPSRVSRRYRKDPAWFSELERTFGMDPQCTYGSVKLYAYHQWGVRLHRDNTSEYLARIIPRVREAVAQWDGSDGIHDLMDSDNPAAFWRLVKNPGEEACIVTVVYKPETDGEGDQ